MPDVEMMIDAYAHIGTPRFGNLPQVIESMKRWRIKKSVLVLGPMVPDYETIFKAAAHYSELFRCIGIPFGQTEEQRLEIARVQLKAGLIGLRMDRNEVMANPGIVELLGSHGRWIYLPGVSLDAELCNTLVKWLDTYPDSRIAAPHFLKAGKDALNELTKHDSRLLVSHPRFYPILSRHGGMGSSEPYPHKDFLPWIRSLVELKGWNRILWGSEYPVFYWRNETMSTVQHWIGELGLNLSSDELHAFFHQNAYQLFFQSPAPPIEQVEVPEWVQQQFNRNRTVPLLPNQPIELPMDIYEQLWNQFVETELYAQGKPLEQFIIEKLGK